jgi:prophage regulatory protein
MIPNEQLLRLPEVRAKLGLSRSAIYRLVAAGKFPQPLKLTPRTIAWRLSELDSWIEAQPRSSSR